MRGLSRIPIRLRLTLAFVLAMAFVLAATGLFLYLRLGSALDQAIGDGLRSRAGDVAALVGQADSGLRESAGAQLAEQGESFAQVLDPGGRVVDATPQLGGSPLLSTNELERAARGPVTLDRSQLPGIDGPARLLAVPVFAQDQRLVVVVVGASLEGRQEALASLRSQLLVGGPLALLLSSLLGYALAAAALQPVESMRRQAAAISASEPGRRLPVPEARDELGRLGATLNEMLARLEEALARERTFVADASHELRTPLALLKTELELALRRRRTPEELEQALRSAADETDRLAQLAEDLLVLARADRGRLPVRKAPVQTAEVAADVAERFAARARQQGRSVIAAAGPQLNVLADRARLEQALGNLVDNALRHGRGDIRVETAERNGYVEFHILDQGGGFPARFLPHAFDRFSRADEARSGDGIGLGLSIVAVIAEAHGGSAHARNREQGGADVWITIPRREP